MSRAWALETGSVHGDWQCPELGHWRLVVSRTWALETGSVQSLGIGDW